MRQHNEIKRKTSSQMEHEPSKFLGKSFVTYNKGILGISASHTGYNCMHTQIRVNTHTPIRCVYTKYSHTKNMYP